MSNALVGSVSRWALFASLLAAASPAQAQLGRLKKMGADAVKDAAKGKAADKIDPAGTKADNAASASKSGTKPADNALNDDRVALVVASLQPMVVEAEKRQARNRALTAHAAKVAASGACMEALTKSFNPMAAASMSDKTIAEIDRINQQMSGAQSRMNAAYQRNDVRTQLFLKDTVNVLTQRSAILTMGGKCTVDFTPSAIIEAQAASQGGTVTGDDADAGKVEPSSAAKAQLTPTQFGVIRERIALWALLQENPNLKGAGKEGVFTAEEQAVLSAHAADIKKLTPFFKDGSMRWSTWGDLKSW